ncbi:unnamed protein product [Prunus brigantina]
MMSKIIRAQPFFGEVGFLIKGQNCPVTLSLPRVSPSLWFSRQPPWPAKFWPAVHSSGHRSGRDRSQNDRPGSAVLPTHSPTSTGNDTAGKCRKHGRFYPVFPELVPAIPATNPDE